LIEEMREQLSGTRHDLDLQTKRMAQLQAEIDLVNARHKPSS